MIITFKKFSTGCTWASNGRKELVLVKLFGNYLPKGPKMKEKVIFAHS
jgi:hypothetical protein